MVVSLKPSRQMAEEPKIPAPQRAPRKNKRARVIASCAAAVVVGAAGWFAFSYVASTIGGSGSPQSAAAANTQNSAATVAAIVEKVGRLIELPKGETPTVATVSDPQKLHDQAFFLHAKAGDIVLLYTGAHEAYLYDPVQDKLVEVAPITTGQ